MTTNCNVSYLLYWILVGKTSHWGDVPSSLRKLKTCCCGTGNQTVEAALMTTPLGWLGSGHFWRVTLTSNLSTVEILFHWCPLDGFILAQKLFTILWATFIMLFFPSNHTCWINNEQITFQWFSIVSHGVWSGGLKLQRKWSCGWLFDCFPRGFGVDIGGSNGDISYKICIGSDDFVTGQALHSAEELGKAPLKWTTEKFHAQSNVTIRRNKAKRSIQKHN